MTNDNGREDRNRFLDEDEVQTSETFRQVEQRQQQLEDITIPALESSISIGSAPVDVPSNVVVDDGSTPFVAPQGGQDPVSAMDLVTKRWASSEFEPATPAPSFGSAKDYLLTGGYDYALPVWFPDRDEMWPWNYNNVGSSTSTLEKVDLITGVRVPGATVPTPSGFYMQTAGRTGAQQITVVHRSASYSLAYTTYDIDTDTLSSSATLTAVGFTWSNYALPTRLFYDSVNLGEGKAWAISSDGLYVIDTVAGTITLKTLWTSLSGLPDAANMHPMASTAQFINGTFYIVFYHYPYVIDYASGVYTLDPVTFYLNWLSGIGMVDDAHGIYGSPFATVLPGKSLTSAGWSNDHLFLITRAAYGDADPDGDLFAIHLTTGQSEYVQVGERYTSSRTRNLKYPGSRYKNFACYSYDANPGHLKLLPIVPTSGTVVADTNLKTGTITDVATEVAYVILSGFTPGGVYTVDVTAQVEGTAAPAGVTHLHADVTINGTIVSPFSMHAPVTVGEDAYVSARWSGFVVAGSDGKIKVGVSSYWSGGGVVSSAGNIVLAYTVTSG